DAEDTVGRGRQLLIDVPDGNAEQLREQVAGASGGALEERLRRGLDGGLVADFGALAGGHHFTTAAAGLLHARAFGGQGRLTILQRLLRRRAARGRFRPARGTRPAWIEWLAVAGGHGVRRVRRSAGEGARRIGVGAILRAASGEREPAGAAREQEERRANRGHVRHAKPRKLEDRWGGWKRYQSPIVDTPLPRAMLPSATRAACVGGRSRKVKQHQK